MYRLSIKRTRKPQDKLCRVYRRRLERIEQIARRERQLISSNTFYSDVLNLASSTENHDNLNISEELVSTVVSNNIIQENIFKPSNELNPHHDLLLNHKLHPSNFVDESTNLNISNELNMDYNVNDTSFSGQLDITAQCEKESEIENIISHLRNAFSSTSMNHVQINSVLHAIHNHSCFKKIPLDARTIMHTPRSPSSVVNLAGGEYLHLGVKKGLIKILQRTPISLIPNHLLLDFSTDGATLDAQGKIQMWPIQIRIPNIHQCKPEIIGIWRGSSKPTDFNEFFKTFVDDLLEVLTSGGVPYENAVYSVEIRCFIADALARAAVLAHTGHKSFYPCSKCWIKGDSIRRGVMSYPSVDNKPRTGEEYANCVDKNHHTDAINALVRLPMNLVKQVPFEYMHSVCIGAMKKFLSVIVFGQYAKHLKLSVNSIQILNKRLAQIKKYCPSDFSRKPDNLLIFSKFKATEFRQILLYSGPAFFYGILNDAVYLHFLILHSALRILVNPFSSAKNIGCAKSLLRIFLIRSVDLYGPQFPSYNIHSLEHLADDFSDYGALDSFSAFPYENNMIFFREACRKPHQHLQQIANRCAERDSVTEGIKNVNVFSNTIPGKPWKSILPSCLSLNCEQYQTLKCTSFSVSVNNNDNTLMLLNGTICVVHNIVKVKDVYKFIIKKFERAVNLYDVGIPSSSMGFFLCSVLINELNVVGINEIRGKCFRMPFWQNNKSEEPIPGVFVVGLLSSTID